MSNNSENNSQVMPASIVGALADAFQKSTQTIYRWIKANDDRLTSDRAKDVYATHGYQFVPRQEVLIMKALDAVANED